MVKAGPEAKICVERNSMREDTTRELYWQPTGKQLAKPMGTSWRPETVGHCERDLSANGLSNG